ncbi:MAG TPA: 16S rRNA (guanine(527)-N(7))-methyltransferase RsmG [Nocardioides sp.]|uniref:16S rRNA (guanine(527)-N(7))-methyltransferase RsmG n=1 Tax=Nocardioides sp. TaxID=35761 RepID=UPI002F3F1014
MPAPDPTVAAAVFSPDRLPLLERYAGVLATDALVRGLIGPREVPRLWDRHLINCGLLGPLIPEGAAVADLGSGAGLPGLVLAIARPDLRVTLVEPMARRVTFLEETCARLHLPNATVVRERAGEWPGAGPFDVVTARALASLSRLVRWGIPLLADRGELLAMKGSSAQEEVAAAEPELRRVSAHAEIVCCSVPGSSVTTVVRVARIGRRG